MSPRYIKCCNTWCDNAADRDGQPCPTCKQRERKNEQTYIDQRAENRAEYERQQKGQQKHGRSEE